MARFFFIFIFFLTLVRLFFGADFTDESQYVSQAYSYLLDGQMFKSDLFLQGTPGVLLSPILKIYTQVLGLEGIVLFFRFLFLLAAASAAAVSYSFLKLHYPSSWALLSASFFLAFIPFSIPSWSYNTVAGLALPTSLYLLLMGNSSTGLLAGIIGGIACFAYPPLAITYTLTLWLIYKKPEQLGKKISKAKKQLFLLGLTLIGIFSVLIIIQTPSEELTNVIKFSRSFGALGGVSKLKSIFNLFKSGLIRGGFHVFLVAFFLIKMIREPQYLARHDYWFLFAGLLLLINSDITEHLGMSWLIYAPLFILTFLCFGRLERKLPDKRPSWFSFFLLLNLISAGIFGYSSSNILINASIGMLMLLQFLTLEAGAALLSSGRASRRQIAIFLGAISFGLCASNYHYVYRDDSIPRLTRQLTSGPYKYIFTTPKRAIFFNRLEEDLTSLRKTHSSLFSAYLSAAYHITDFVPVTKMLYVHDIFFNPPQIDLILDRTLKDQEWPELVVVKTIERSDFKYQFEDFFIGSGKYTKIIERSDYRIWSLVK